MKASTKMFLYALVGVAMIVAMGVLDAWFGVPEYVLGPIVILASAIIGVCGSIGAILWSYRD